jgi:hypothetical protein
LDSVTQADGEEFDSVLRGVAASPDVALPPSSKVGERFLLFRTLGEGSFVKVIKLYPRTGTRIGLQLRASSALAMLERKLDSRCCVLARPAAALLPRDAASRGAVTARHGRLRL